jgi:hypothetical protein
VHVGQGVLPDLTGETGELPDLKFLGGDSLVVGLDGRDFV